MSASRVQIVNQTSFFADDQSFFCFNKKDTQKMNVLVVAFFLMKSHFNLTIIIIDCICGVCLVAMMELQMILPGSGV